MNCDSLWAVTTLRASRFALVAFCFRNRSNSERSNLSPRHRHWEILISLEVA